MIYHSTQSNHYLWYLILRGKQEAKKLKHTRIQSSSLFSMVGTIKRKLNSFINIKSNAVRQSNKKAEHLKKHTTKLETLRSLKHTQDKLPPHSQWSKQKKPGED